MLGAELQGGDPELEPSTYRVLAFTAAARWVGKCSICKRTPKMCECVREGLREERGGLLSAYECIMTHIHHPKNMPLLYNQPFLWVSTHFAFQLVFGGDE